jgi:uncharacterized protein YybS (DUF2232 family)
MKLKNQYTVITVCLPIIVFLWWFLIVLLSRIRQTEYGTSLDIIHIIGYYFLGICLLIFVFFVNRKDLINFKVFRILLIGIAIPELIFFILNFFGIIWEYQKGRPVGIPSLIKSFFY